MNIEVEKIRGKAVTLLAAGGLEEYTKTFLAVFNTMRDNSELYHINNYSWNDEITVYCSIDMENKIVNYLSQFGTVVSVEDVDLYLPYEDETNQNTQVFTPLIY